MIDYIESNMAEHILLDELAQISSLSKYHFNRIFYSFTNEPFYAFDNRRMTECSAALLLTQSISIIEIAFTCGFNDSATFSRVFKKHVAMSATEWRKSKNSKIHQDRYNKPPLRELER